MKDFRKQNGQGNGRNEGFENRGGGSDSRPPRRDFDNRSGGGHNKYQGDYKGSRSDGSMHKAVCSECGKSCEVPFAPSGNKPVYCSDCFGKKKGSHAGGYEKRDFAPRGPVAHEARPQQASQPQQRDTRIDELKAQVDAINTKLDRMMKVLLETNTAPVQKSNPVVKKEEKKVASVIKKPAAKVVAKAKPAAKKKK